MPQVTENLMPSEEVTYQSHKHWIAPVRDSLPAAGLLILAAVVSAILPTGDGILSFLWTIIGWLRWAAIIVAIAWIIYDIVVWRTAEFAVTTLRVLRYEGLIRKRSSETLLSAVTDVKLSVGFLGKNLGYGDLRIFTQSGDAGADTFKSITGAAEFRNAMMNVKIADQQASRPAPAPAAAPAAAPAPAAPPQSADDAATALVRLSELRDQGVITPAEFEAKKAEILARM